MRQERPVLMPLERRAKAGPFDVDLKSVQPLVGRVIVDGGKRGPNVRTDKAGCDFEYPGVGVEFFKDRIGVAAAANAPRFRRLRTMTRLEFIPVFAVLKGFAGLDHLVVSSPQACKLLTLQELVEK